MKLMFCMLINIIVFYKLILLLLMMLARHAQSTQTSVQCLWHLKKEVTNEVRDCTNWFRYYFCDILYIQCSLTIKSFLHSIWNRYWTFYLINLMCNISLLRLFQVAVGPCNLAGCCSFLHLWILTNETSSLFIISKLSSLINQPIQILLTAPITSAILFA